MDFSMFENMWSENDSKRMNYKTQTVHNHDSMKSRFPEHTPLAMAYVPVQQWNDTCELDKGFECGTIFPELILPFNPEEGCYGQR